MSAISEVYIARYSYIVGADNDLYAFLRWATKRNEKESEMQISKQKPHKTSKIEIETDWLTNQRHTMRLQTASRLRPNNNATTFPIRDFNLNFDLYATLRVKNDGGTMKFKCETKSWQTASHVSETKNRILNQIIESTTHRNREGRLRKETVFAASLSG